ncbi:hypothetical protein TWF696_004281 [Orbilia brochopaga]|uniref:Uncharacterized protein n=1 Tax=Orbilia brochopaga TaxID=3140254 RepID=A0AAV9V5R8_9PEZI
MSADSPTTPDVAECDSGSSAFAAPTLMLTKLSVPAVSYSVEPFNTIIINLTLHPRVVITCSTVSGHELGYFGWSSGAVDISFEDDSEVVISYSSTPSIWSSGQRVPETKEYLAERVWFHTFANVVTRGGSSDDGGVMRLSVTSLSRSPQRKKRRKSAAAVADAGANADTETYKDTIASGKAGTCTEDAATGHAAEDAMHDDYMDGGDEVDDSGGGGGGEEEKLPAAAVSPSRGPRTQQQKKRVVKGKIGKIGKVKRGSIEATEAMKKLAALSIE